MDLIKELLLHFSGGPEEIALIILVLGMLWIFGHYFIVLVEWMWIEVHPKLKKEGFSFEPTDYNRVFDSYFKEKIIVLIENQLKNLKDFNKIFKDNYEDNVENMINNFGKERNREITKKIFEIYEKITDLREKYAGKTATREEFLKLSDEIKELEKEVFLLKEKVNKME